MTLKNSSLSLTSIQAYTNATVKKGGPLGNMTLKKKGVIQDLRKVKKRGSLSLR